MDVKLNPC